MEPDLQVFLDRVRQIVRKDYYDSIQVSECGQVLLCPPHVMDDTRVDAKKLFSSELNVTKVVIMNRHGGTYTLEPNTVF